MRWKGTSRKNRSRALVITSFTLESTGIGCLAGIMIGGPDHWSGDYLLLSATGLLAIGGFFFNKVIKGFKYLSEQ